MSVGIYLWFLTLLWASRASPAACWAAVLVLSMRCWSCSPMELLAMAFTTVNGSAEKTTTPASYPHYPHTENFWRKTRAHNIVPIAKFGCQRYAEIGTVHALLVHYNPDIWNQLRNILCNWKKTKLVMSFNQNESRIEVHAYLLPCCSTLKLLHVLRTRSGPITNNLYLHTLEKILQVPKENHTMLSTLERWNTLDWNNQRLTDIHIFRTLSKTSRNNNTTNHSWKFCLAGETRIQKNYTQLNEISHLELEIRPILRWRNCPPCKTAGVGKNWTRHRCRHFP